MATLNGFSAVPETATRSGASIDAFQMNGFRKNDILFEKVIQSLMCSPFMPTSMIDTTDNKAGHVEIKETDIIKNTVFARTFLNAKTIHVTEKCILTARVPMIWIARERIIIEAEIDASGKGAAAEEGDFGGSGGGGATAGKRCLMPFALPTTTNAEEEILKGGLAGEVGKNLATADAWKLSRALLYLPFLVGGAAGSDGGGAGGGVVCLCAPVIEFRGKGQVNASGKDAPSNNKGGGGGGLVYFIARQIDGTADIKINGGQPKGGTGKAGGDGKFIPHVFN